MYDVIIVGGGSASFSAAIYTARNLLKTLIVTKKFGGQTAMSSEVENYPGFKKILGVELIMKMREHAESLGAKVNDAEEVKTINIKSDKNFEVITNIKKYKTRSIIIASGKKPRKLGVSGEKEFMGKGVAYCVTCDAPMFKGKDVAVIGGGNSGLDAAMELTKYAKKIYILEYANTLKGDKKTQMLLSKNKKIEGKQFVEKLVYEDKISNIEKNIKVQGVFVEIGWETISDFTPMKIKKNKFKEIIVDQKTQATSVKGIYAAGDVTDGLYKQTIVACGDAAKAALSVNEYLK